MLDRFIFHAVRDTMHMKIFFQNQKSLRILALTLMLLFQVIRQNIEQEGDP